MEMHWPDGRHGSLVIEGLALDTVTDAIGVTRIAARDRLTVTIAPDKTIQAIVADPPLAGLEELVGLHCMSGYRRLLRNVVDPIALAHRPLVLLLEDIVGCSVISGFLWSREPTDDAVRVDAELRLALEGVCVGFAPGSDAFDTRTSEIIPVLGSANPMDMEGLHPLRDDEIGAVRRIRRIDMVRDGTVATVDSTFQDSGVAANGRREILHEYAVEASFDPEVEQLRSLAATPHVLPYAACLNAPAGLARLVGEDVAALRPTVLTELRGVHGCTHLNEAVRALAELPQLWALLPA